MVADGSIDFGSDIVVLGRRRKRAMQGTDEGSLDFGLNRALDAWYNDRAWFQSLARRCMLQVGSAKAHAMLTRTVLRATEALLDTSLQLA